MNIKQTILTDEGLHKLESELEFLKSKKRKEIADQIKTAISFGDLSENSEYDEAKNEQAMVEERISTLENLLKNVIVLDEDDITTDYVGIGSVVKVLDIEFNEEETFKVVGSTETDPNKGQISDESPIGSALLSHRVGDTVVADTPGGPLEFKILEISK